MTLIDAPAAPFDASRFLSVNDLRVQFPTEDGVVKAVDGLSFSLERGRTLAIVGESGSGKSVTSQAIMGLINRSSATVEGQVVLEGQDLIAMSNEEVRRLRGAKMAMIFQDPLSSLHPYYSISRQLVEAVRVHQKVSKADARKQCIGMLDRVGIPSAEKRIDDFPHQLSGGMRQRVMIAMALLNSPDLLIADEPTTALDVTVQAQIIDLLKSIQQEFNTAIIIITHDLGVVADTADDVAVMYAGRVVEYGSVEGVYRRPQMPYTLGLLASVPRIDRARVTRLDPIPGTPPSLIALPSGCAFRPRCTFSAEVPDNLCSDVRPDLAEVTDGHQVSCHLTPEKRLRNADAMFALLDGRSDAGAQAATPSDPESGDPA